MRIEADSYTTRSIIGEAEARTTSGKGWATLVIQREYQGDVTLSLIPQSVLVSNLIYTGNVISSLVPGSTIITDWLYTAGIGIILSPGSPTVVAGYLPYQIRAIVKINGEDYSGSLYNAITVSKEEDSAATFTLSIDTASLPTSFLDKEIEIGFQAADESGLVLNVTNLVVGRIREVEKDVDSGSLTFSGYDYGGVHNNLGELYNGEITEVLTGDIYINAAGTYNVGKNPIWDVVYAGTNEDIQDGRDYFVDTLNGIIYIPFSSGLITSPGTLQYKYGVYFNTFAELVQAIADVKKWNISLENTELPEFSNKKYQPLIALSNESIIDVLKKCLEIAGCKIDTSLYPVLRVYSEVVNSTSAGGKQFTESSIYEDTLSIWSSLENLINKQTVRSVSVVNTNVVLGDWEEISTETGSVPHKNFWWFPYTYDNNSERQQAYEAALDKMNNTPEDTAADLSVSLDSLYDYDCILTGGGNPYTFRISNYFSINATSIKGDANTELDFDTDTLKVSITRPLKIMELQILVLGWRWYGYLLYYPQVDWNLAVNGKKLEYGDGAATPTVEVTGTKKIPGISVDLIGDAYEHPYLETQNQAKALCKAILYSRSIKHEASFSVPMHLATDLMIGKRASVVSKGKTVDGLIKGLEYSIDIEQGSGEVGVTLKGGGANI